MNEKAVLDCREARHAAEEIAECAFVEQVGREIDEGAMDIVLGNSRRDAVDVCGGHSVPFVALRLVP